MEMTFRPMTPTERMYSYTQSQQLIMQTGCIGHLRGDFGSTGEQFFTSWDDHRADLKSDAFKQEFDEVIDALRKNKSHGCVLKSRKDLLSACAKTPDSSFGNGREYGFRADTEHYSYMFRLNPGKGEYNIYCYCYLKQWLDRHMKHAEKGIRFITPDYKELFRIADGDSIRYYTAGGEVRQPTCRYIDDYHFETVSPGFGDLYHICEFAEKYQSHNCTGIIPLRKSLPDKCFSYLESTGEMIVITKGEKGYTPTGTYPQNSSPKAGAFAINEANGVSRAQEAAMVAGSMFGWDVPAADPRNYNENGEPIRPQRKDRSDAR